LHSKRTVGTFGCRPFSFPGLEMRRLILLSALLSLAACTGRDQPPPRHAEQVVDSVIPREEALRRFREGVPEVRELSGGVASRAALATAVTRALASRDTAALNTLLLTKEEFAWLYYPTAAQGLPPYDLSPSLYWFTLEGRNGRALRSLLDDPTSVGAKYVSHVCDSASTKEGENTLWGPCILRSTGRDGKPLTARSLSLVIERGGKWKVVSYSAGRD
jgi:hypothetical protein